MKASMKFTFKDNFQAIKARFSGKLDEAFDTLQEETVDWVHDKMLNGYSDPHGEDGHTQIYDTGALYDSITAEIERRMFILHKLSIGSPLDYAVYVHNGTRKLVGRPFLRDALEEHTGEFGEIIKHAIEE